MLNFEKYVRRPFYVTSVIVTAENMAEVAEWCGGEILTEKQSHRTVRYIKVPVARPMSEKQTKAFVADRVLKTKTDFKVYTEDAFQRSFQQAPFPVEPPTEMKGQVPLYNPEYGPKSIASDEGMKGQVPLFEIVDETTAREVCGKTMYTIDSRPCVLDKDHGKRPCTSIFLGQAREDNMDEGTKAIYNNPKFPKAYPKPSGR